MGIVIEHQRGSMANSNTCGNDGYRRSTPADHRWDLPYGPVYYEYPGRFGKACGELVNERQ